MRPLSLFTSITVLIIIQTLISTWFLFDFFLTRDSLTANSLWNKTQSEKLRENDKLYILSQKVRHKHCPPEEYDSREPIFDKVVLIVIDALGSEFLPSINDPDGSTMKMSFVEKLIRDKKAMGFVAKAATPTVTMPRIKALLSGTIPSFIDVVYNLAQDVSKFDDDNILRIAKSRDKNIAFYGDDTWLSLFDRSTFIRAKETYSFYANDFISVDTNVTNQALPETNLPTLDWDYLILHYLGLDHIGHVFGTNKNLLIDEKLREMDSVIEKIYENLLKKTQTKTLVVITGDHGMSPEGNHGGNSKLETETAMIFLPINHELSISSETFDMRVKQIDFSNTLATVMSLPSPSLSKGVGIEPFLASTIKDKKTLNCAAFTNTIQLLSLMNKNNFENFPEREDLVKLLNSHYESPANFTNIELIPLYFKISRKIQEKLIETIANNSNPMIIITFLTIATFLTIVAMRGVSIHNLLLTMSPRPEMYLSIVALLSPILMHGSTDFIEAENVFWPAYCLFTSLVFFIVAYVMNPGLSKELQPLRVGLLIATFILTSFWNNYHLFRETLSNTTLTVIASAFMCNSMMQSCDIHNSKLKKYIVLTLSFCIFSCRIVEESPDYNSTFVIIVQRIVIIYLAIYTLMNILSTQLVKGGDGDEPIARFIRKLATSWIVLVFLLARPYNLLFIMANVILEASVNNVTNTLRLSKVTKILFYIHYAQSAFYNLGNTNLFTTIDVRPAFYGQSVYNIILSVPLVIISTYSTQIYWYMKLFQRFQENHLIGSLRGGKLNRSQMSIKKNMMMSILEFVTYRNFLSLSYYMYVCIVLRNHLFIWSVISPKLIYHYVSNIVILTTCLTVTFLQRTKSRLLLNENERRGGDKVLLI